MRQTMNPTISQEKLLHDISVISFVLTDLNLYLDTHPSDQSALEYFGQYSKIDSQLRREYTLRFGPLVASDYDKSMNKWLWALTPMPWEGGC